MNKEKKEISIFGLATLDYGESHEALLTNLHAPISASVRRGRNVVTGYGRSWGLEFGGIDVALAKMILFTRKALS
ncbi:MAG: hypothetical protein K2W99_04975 [Chthoniobacterales bacterium]|nr:hypothetical protein [Chthoniobacterales bacterium]